MSEEQPFLPSPSSEDVFKGISNWEASYHIICVIAGTGLLQIPFAFSQAGWIGILFLIGSAWVNYYTGNLIIKCLEVNGKYLDGYPHIGLEAFGRAGFYIISIFYNMALCGTVCLYIILASMNLEQLIGWSSQNWIIALCICLLIPFLAVKTLKEVGFISFLGALASLLVVVIVTICGLSDYPMYVDKVEHKWADSRAFGSVLGTLCFSYGGNYVYPEVYRTMAKKEKFPNVLKYSIVLITIMYLVVGIIGYFVYGDLSISPVLFNLSGGFMKSFSLGIITFHVVFACPLLLTTISKDLERMMDIESYRDTSILRIAIVGLICSISMSLPFFSDMMSLVGAVSNTMLIFVLPILGDFKVFEKNNFVLGCLIIIIGLVGGGIGTFDALTALYEDIIHR